MTYLTCFSLGFAVGYLCGFLNDKAAWDRFMVSLFGRNDDEECATQ